MRGVLVALVLGAALFAPGLARAEEHTLVFTTGAIQVEGYGVATRAILADSPDVDGHVVGLVAEVVDAVGNVQGRDAVMLHHIVFAKLGTPDATCGGIAERFYAEGEERTRLELPTGYGYPNRAGDRWGLLYMLMNHRPQPLKGFIRYTVRYVTGEDLAPVKPVWLDVRNCSGPDPVFDVPGGGARGSSFTRTAEFRLPESGRIVAGGAHLHGGGVRLELRNASCGSTPFVSRPTWGGPIPKPILHEPGPAHMSQFTSSEGVPVAAGQTLRLVAVYDNERPHTRAMGIMLLFVAAAEVSGCGATPTLAVDDGAPSPPPQFSMPLPRKPRGSVTRTRATSVRDFRFGHERVLVPLGATFTWRFAGTVQHDVTVVGGPRGFSSPWTQSGEFRHRFTRPGTYRLFCSLHPTRMVQTVSVR